METAVKQSAPLKTPTTQMRNYYVCIKSLALAIETIATFAKLLNMLQ